MAEERREDAIARLARGTSAKDANTADAARVALRAMYDPDTIRAAMACIAATRKRREAYEERRNAVLDSDAWDDANAACRDAIAEEDAAYRAWDDR